jgi:hypothetical protein
VHRVSASPREQLPLLDFEPIQNMERAAPDPEFHRMFPPLLGEMLDDILHYICQQTDLDAGIIYIADYKARILRCWSYMGCEGMELDRRYLGYDFDQPALATKVFREEQPYFAETPDDPNVAIEGAVAFHIASSLVGLPLVFYEIPVGSLVLWSRRQQHFWPKELDKKRLLPFAQFAAERIGTWQINWQRAQVIRLICRLLDSRHGIFNFQKSFSIIMRAVQAADFERVQVFEYDRTRGLLICFASLDASGSNRFQGLSLDAKANRYAADIVYNSQRGTRAYAYDPGTSYGTDPDHDRLERARIVPWAVVRLMAEGKFCGCIMVDNRLTGRPITERSLDYLTLIGSNAGKQIEYALLVNKYLPSIKFKAIFIGQSSANIHRPLNQIRTIVADLITKNDRASRGIREQLEAIANLARYASHTNRELIKVAWRDRMENIKAFDRYRDELAEDGSEDLEYNPGGNDPFRFGKNIRLACAVGLLLVICSFILSIGLLEVGAGRFTGAALVFLFAGLSLLVLGVDRAREQFRGNT